MDIGLVLCMLAQNLFLNGMATTSQKATTELLESDKPEIVHEVNEPFNLRNKYDETTQKPDVCYCAAFSTRFPEKDTPILIQSAISRITCNLKAEESCKRNCSIIAEAANGQVPPVLCYLLGNYNKLRVSVHSRTSCRNSQWAFTGLSSVNPICCKKSKVVRCKAVPRGSKRRTAITTWIFKQRDL
ncbi:hypothetical protein ILUMI_03544 [Ignelater luminosus]|uniref:Uncharacterized protein n=1 Tax=Ignelater luminosus TaxID=2038154 RepID=A0A8K0DFL5_IGNLU|nr:hypothetical protein ILUMI_03544 [Ignelater luminosus]